MVHSWKKEEIKFLIKNYPKNGFNYCSEKLNIDKAKVKSKVGTLKLKLVDKYDIKNFIKITKKEVAYIMGLLWSDGNIYEPSHSINLTANYDDMLNIENIIMKTSNWNKYFIKGRYRNDTLCKNNICYNINSKQLYYILKKYDFHLKSKVSPNKILEIIPDKIKHYFFRGLVDGDGWFYINKKNYNNQFGIASSLEQDWSYMIELSKLLDIKKYTIKKQITKKGKSSMFRITNKKDILKLGEYLYKDYDKIGFKRKYDKYKQIIS